MPIYRLGDLTPTIDDSAWIADSAVIIGDVRLGAGVNVWPGAVLRGDNEPIVLGAGCNVQEGAVLHTDPGFPLVLADHVTVGHQAMLHGCTLGEAALVGIQAVVMNGARIGRECIVGAGALVTEAKVFEEGTMILGSPAKAARALSAEQRASLRGIAERYVARGQRYRNSLVRVR